MRIIWIQSLCSVFNVCMNGFVVFSFGLFFSILHQNHDAKMTFCLFASLGLYGVWSVWMNTYAFIMWFVCAYKFGRSNRKRLGKMQLFVLFLLLLVLDLSCWNANVFYAPIRMLNARIRGFTFWPCVLRVYIKRARHVHFTIYSWKYEYSLIVIP